ncbi:MAG: response regulator [Candidatus Manganitrophaceae bacterium]
MSVETDSVDYAYLSSQWSSETNAVQKSHIKAVWIVLRNKILPGMVLAIDPFPYTQRSQLSEQQMKNLLLADPDKNLVEALAELMRNLLAEIHLPDCNVFTTCLSYEAIKVMNRRPIDILLADYNLPDINGLELIRTVHLRGWNNTARILSAHACKVDYLIDVSGINGVDTVMKTPLQREELKQNLKRFLLGDSWIDRQETSN